MPATTLALIRPSTRRARAARGPRAGALAVAAATALGAAVLGPAAPAPAHPGHEGFARFAQIERGDGILRKGCHDYRYRYEVEVKPRFDQWALETFLVDRRGERVAAGALLKGADPKTGVDSVRFCRTATVPGRFTLRGKLTLQNVDEIHDGFIKPIRFRLRLPS